MDGNDDVELTKPGARCSHYRACSFYNAGFLPHQVELEMCGKGAKKPDESYKPLIPEHLVEKKRAFDFELDPGGFCPAYEKNVYLTYFVDVEYLTKKLNESI